MCIGIVISTILWWFVATPCDVLRINQHIEGPRW